MVLHEHIIDSKAVKRPRDALLFDVCMAFLRLLVRRDSLRVVCLSTGQEQYAGQKLNPSFVLVIKTPRVLWTMLSNPDPGAGEMFMDGSWWLERGDIGAFITLLARSFQNLLKGPLGLPFNALLHKTLNIAAHDIAESKNNVRRHYDLGNDLYQSFLDEGMNYSCAFFEGRPIGLREAQLNKLHTTFQRLGISPGMRVLDIGCGWGEASRLVAQKYAPAAVMGITLSDQQIALARQKAAGMAHPPRYKLEDYRNHTGQYDRIFSIGMFEHVGSDQYRTYFATIRRLLAPGGRTLVHCITNTEPPSKRFMNSPWLETYIFPGGDIPHLTEILDAAHQEGLRPVRESYLQPPSDYAETLRHWRKNFLAHQSQLDPVRYDQRFRRMWTYYFAMCEAMFDGCGFQVTQTVFEIA